MFPHKFDRYNVLYFLIKHHFQKLNLNRSDFAKESALSQSAVSNLLNFSRAEAFVKGHKGTPQQKPFRIETLGQACRRFQLSEIETEALTWLLYPEGNRKPELRTEILKMLDRVVKEKSTSEIREVDVQLVGSKGRFNIDESKSVIENEIGLLHTRLFEMSCKPGHRMVVSKFPTSATHPEKIVSALTTDGKRRAVKFRHNVSRNGCGERHIHSKTTIERYLNENSPCSFLPIESRRDHVENLIETLENPANVNFEIGLADEEPEIELALRSIDVVGIRTTSREILLKDPTKDPFSCGPAYLFIHDQMTVLSCFLDFEREWARIPEEFREKEQVVKWLRKALDESKS